MIAKGKDAVDFAVGQPFRNRHHAAGALREQAGLARAHPDGAVARFRHRNHRRPPHLIARGQGLHVVARVPHRPVNQAGQEHVAVLRRRHGGDARLGFGERGHRVFEGTVVVLADAGPLLAHPQVALAVDGQPEHVCHRRRGGIRRLDQAEAHAVEPHEPFFGADPEIAVGRLRERRDHTAGEALLDAEVVAEILRHRAIRVGRAREPRQAHHRQQHDEGAEATAGTRTSQ